MDNSIIEESIKQGKGYLSKIYSLQKDLLLIIQMNLQTIPN